MSDEETSAATAAAEPAPNEGGDEGKKRRTFQKEKHLIRVQGGREYLPVSARLIWFREEHPDWGIATTPIEINLEKQYAIYQATIYNAEGRLMATATKMENVRGFPDYLEKAETGSVGRALAFCGYGTQFAPEMDEGERRIVDAPNRHPDERGGRERPAERPDARASATTTGTIGRPADAEERERLLNDFAADAWGLGFDVTVKAENSDDEQYSPTKLGTLIVELTRVVKPSSFAGWLPNVGVLKAARERLPKAAAERKLTPRRAPAAEAEAPPPDEPAPEAERPVAAGSSRKERVGARPGRGGASAPSDDDLSNLSDPFAE